MSSPIGKKHTDSTPYVESKNRSFTPEEIKFFNSIKDAKAAFDEFDRVPDDPKKKQQFVQDLEIAFGSLYEIAKTTDFKSSELQHRMAQLFFLLGHSQYPGQMEKSRYFFQAALSLKLSAFKLKEENVLKILTAHASTSSLYENLEKEALHSNFSTLTDLPEKILSDVSAENLKSVVDKSELFELSRILRMLGHACQNIDKFHEGLTKKDAKQAKDDIDRFELIYGLAKECNQNIIDNSAYKLKSDASWEMVEVIYNTDRFVYDLKNQEPSAERDALAKIKLLENVKPYLKNVEDKLKAARIAAQIENITAIEKYRISEINKNYLVEGYEHVSKAVQIAESTPNFPANLLNNFKNVKTAIEVKVKENIDFSKLEAEAIRMLEFVRVSEDYYNSIHIIGAARLYLLLDNKEKALDLLDKAEEVANKSPENASDMLKSIQELRDKILGVERTQ